MATLDKIIQGLSGVTLLLISAALAYTLYGGQEVILYLRHFSVAAPIDGGILALLIGLLGVYLLIMGLREEKQRALVHSTQLGAVKISLNTIKGLVERCVRSEQGVKDVQVNLEEGESLKVHLELKLLPDFHIPELSEKLQQRVKEYLQQTVGITVKEVQVMVKGIVGEGKTRLE